MVSVIEKIQPEEIDGDDDSDAPLEVTTKTSKVEKRKKKNKKKSNKRRLKYNLATDKDQDLHEKRVDEESALTHLVFGDDEEYLDELISATSPDKKVHLGTDDRPRPWPMCSFQDVTIKTKKEAVESKKPVWVDSEEVTEELWVHCWMMMSFYILHLQCSRTELQSTSS